MNKEAFLLQLEQDLEITSVKLTGDTLIQDIPEWDSLASMTTLAIIDEHFGLDIDITKMNNLQKINDLFTIIGEEKFKEAV